MKYVKGKPFVPIASRLNAYEQAAQRSAGPRASKALLSTQKNQSTIKLGLNFTAGNLKPCDPIVFGATLDGLPFYKSSAGARLQGDFPDVAFEQHGIKLIDSFDFRPPQVAIVLEPILKDEIGRVCVGGAAWAKVDIQNVADRFVYFDPTNNAFTSTPVRELGVGEILTPTPDGTGTSYHLVQMLGLAAYQLFPVAVEQTGGSPGDETQKASFTYTIKDLVTDQAIEIGAAPEYESRTNVGKFVAATKGTAYMDEQGAIKLYSVDEVPDVILCDEVTA